MSPATAPPRQVADYTVLPLSLAQLASYAASATHYLYLRPHEPKVPHPDSPRSLFLANVPVDSTSFHFRTIFTDQLGGGRIERVDFEDAPAAKKASLMLQGLKSKSRKRKRGGEDTEAVPELPEAWDRELHSSGSTAVVVFADRPSMESAYKAARKAVKAGAKLAWAEGVEDKISELGSQRYLHHHILQYPPTATLQSSIDAYMTAFSALEASRARALARQRSIPDADGFVTVTRGARTGPARLHEAQEKAEELRKKDEQKKKGMGDFYRFQTRERKKEEAGQLIRRFEEDRKRVEDMRKGRGNRFKSA